MEKTKVGRIVKTFFLRTCNLIICYNLVFLPVPVHAQDKASTTDVISSSLDMLAGVGTSFMGALQGQQGMQATEAALANTRSLYKPQPFPHEVFKQCPVLDAKSAFPAVGQACDDSPATAEKLFYYDSLLTVADEIENDYDNFLVTANNADQPKAGLSCIMEAATAMEQSLLASEERVRKAVDEMLSEIEDFKALSKQDLDAVKKE
jgi:hypothetical protein